MSAELTEEEFQKAFAARAYRSAGLALTNRHRMAEQWMTFLPGFIQQGMDQGAIAPVRDPSIYELWKAARATHREARRAGRP